MLTTTTIAYDHDRALDAINRTHDYGLPQLAAGLRAQGMEVVYLAHYGDDYDAGSEWRGVHPLVTIETDDLDDPEHSPSALLDYWAPDGIEPRDLGAVVAFTAFAAGLAVEWTRLDNRCIRVAYRLAR